MKNNILPSYLKNLFNKESKIVEMDEEQKLINEIIKTLCDNKSSRILTRTIPSVGNQYNIFNADNGYYVVITGNCVMVTSNELYLVRYFQPEMIKSIIDIVDARINTDSDSIRTFVQNKELTVLRGMLNSLSNE